MRVHELLKGAEQAVDLGVVVVRGATDPKTGQPVENGLRDMWVTSTALSTSLNTAYFAERVATFAIVMGFALLLTGIGFLVLTVKLLVPRTASEKAPIASAVPS